MHYFIAKNNEWVNHLNTELCKSYGKNMVRRVDNLPLLQVQGSVELKNPQVGFSLNALPESVEIDVGPIGEQEKKILRLVTAAWDSGCRVNLHVFSISSKFTIIETGRAEILRDKLHKSLKKAGYFLRKKSDFGQCHQLQVMIFPERKLALSLVHCERVLSDFFGILSPFSGGFTTLGDDKKAPSRAFKKLVEAQKVLGVEIKQGEKVVDLGACPGGWTYVARQQGADVVAIDRSEIRLDLLHDPQVKFLKVDAFTFKTQEPADWVISDIICAPERILELLKTWVTSQHCRYFVFTIKFQGSDGYSVLEKFKKMTLELRKYSVILRQLNVNKNEVTIMGKLKE